MAANKPPRAQVAWSQVKAKLADLDRAGLIALLQDLYAASRENQAFLHSRFGLGEDPLRPYKETIARSLWPDLNKPISVAAAKKAISGYSKAAGHAEGTAELMVFFCEQAAGFVRDMGLQDEGYFDALLRMYARALTAAAALQDAERADKSSASVKCARFAATSATASSPFRAATRHTRCCHLLDSASPPAPVRIVSVSRLEHRVVIRIV